MPVPVVVDVVRTSAACPAQWEGRTADGQWFYARLRHGYFYAGLGPTLDAAIFSDSPGSEEGSVLLMEYSFEDETDGAMTDEEMRETLGGRVTWQ